MSEFVNTRDEIGDQATVDGLVSHTLTELKEDGIGIVETYACYKNTGLQSVELPSVSQIKATAFDSCSNLEVVKLGGEGSSNSLSIATNAFNACSKLKHFLIDRPAMATASDTSILYGTPIYRGEGAVYVPENLVATYKADNNWNKYFITRLDKYPLSVFDSIEDSWSTILSNSSYATDYAVKDTKTLELTDGTKIKMDLAAIDTDVKSDNSGTAKMTWICHGILRTYPQSTPAAADSTNGGWANSLIRTYLINDVLSKIPTEIKSHIVSVKKSYRIKSPTDETLWSDDEIWIPSYYEIYGSESSSESAGNRYADYTSSSLKKVLNGNPTNWWLRTAFNTTSYYIVNTSGSYYNNASTGSLGIVFGFCTD